MHTGVKPPTSVKIALDLTNGLTTCIYSKIGSPWYGDEVVYEAFFGIAEMEGVETARYLRHEFTDELVGRSFSRTYSDNMTSMHLYTTPHSSAWTIYMGRPDPWYAVVCTCSLCKAQTRCIYFQFGGGGL